MRNPMGVFGALLLILGSLYGANQSKPVWQLGPREVCVLAAALANVILAKALK